MKGSKGRSPLYSGKTLGRRGCCSTLRLVGFCRYVPMFGDAEYDPSQSYLSVPFEEQFQAVVDAREAGKILEFGVSNETPWGLMRFCETGRH